MSADAADVDVARSANGILREISRMVNYLACKGCGLLLEDAFLITQCSHSICGRCEERIRVETMKCTVEGCVVQVRPRDLKPDFSIRSLVATVLELRDHAVKTNPHIPLKRTSGLPETLATAEDMDSSCSDDDDSCDAVEDETDGTCVPDIGGEIAITTSNDVGNTNAAETENVTGKPGQGIVTRELRSDAAKATAETQDVNEGVANGAKDELLQPAVLQENRRSADEQERPKDGSPDAPHEEASKAGSRAPLVRPTASNQASSAGEESVVDARESRLRSESEIEPHSARGFDQAVSEPLGPSTSGLATTLPCEGSASSSDCAGSRASCDGGTPRERGGAHAAGEVSATVPNSAETENDFDNSPKSPPQARLSPLSTKTKITLETPSNYASSSAPPELTAPSQDSSTHLPETANVQGSASLCAPTDKGAVPPNPTPMPNEDSPASPPPKTGSRSVFPISPNRARKDKREAVGASSKCDGRGRESRKRSADATGAFPKKVRCVESDGLPEVTIPVPTVRPRPRMVVCLSKLPSDVLEQCEAVCSQCNMAVVREFGVAGCDPSVVVTELDGPDDSRALFDGSLLGVKNMGFAALIAMTRGVPIVGPDYLFESEKAGKALPLAVHAAFMPSSPSGTPALFRHVRACIEHGMDDRAMAQMRILIEAGGGIVVTDLEELCQGDDLRSETDIEVLRIRIRCDVGNMQADADSADRTGGAKTVDLAWLADCVLTGACPPANADVFETCADS